VNSRPDPAIFFYITDHGFGHASRQIEIINALGAAAGRGAEIVLRTSAARWLFDRTIDVPFTFSEAHVDTGVVQIDSLHLDERETIRRAARFHRALIDKAQAEAALLRGRHARLVVADAPPLGCAAAAAAGVPSVVCSNFTWDWIYQAYADADPEAADLIARIQEAYRKAHAAWRLPMHGGFETLANIVDVPLVARHARLPRDEVRRRLGLPLEQRLALVSFGAYGVRDLDPAALDCLDDVGVVLTGRGPAAPGLPRGALYVAEEALYDSGPRYEDLVGAVDAVVTKPGYGIVSECIANDTALLYTSRGRFPEYDVFVQEMPRYLRCRFIPQEDLLAGRWRDSLEKLMAQADPPERPATNGAEVVAEMIERMV
jgi:hypothetical protein